LSLHPLENVLPVAAIASRFVLLSHHAIAKIRKSSTAELPP
jgi:hypothetical protein